MSVAFKESQTTARQSADETPQYGTSLLNLTRHDWRMALIVAEREMRDTTRDWRLVIPILGLTLFFPGLMTIVATQIAQYVGQYGAELIGERAVPLLLLVVGFFPTSFSLVIALEAFVGEKERKSLEPLLATPLTNYQLFTGKLIASVVPPVVASYIGITVYTLGVFLTGNGSSLDFSSFTLVILITTFQAVLMVAAAVVISSQTTSTRAANMLASFIIVPVALLLQFEGYLMAFYSYDALWWMVLFVGMVAAVFVRIGIQQFDREQLLGRQIDFIRFNVLWTLWRDRFLGRDEPNPKGGLKYWYAQTWSQVPQLRLPMILLMSMLVVSAIGGVVLALFNPLPPEILTELRGTQSRENMLAVQTYLADLPLFIFAHNIRAILLLVIFGTLSFGILTALIFMLPWGIIAFVATQFATVGENPLVFVGATILPHAWVELPILLIVTASALRWQAVIISPSGHRTMSEAWTLASAEFFRILFGFGVPFFLLAALLESFLTPAVMLWVYG